MNRTRAQSRGSTDIVSTGGFTLIEMTVALALMAIVSVVLIESVQLGQHAYGQAAAANRKGWEAFTAHRFLRNLIESAYPIDDDHARQKRAYGIVGDQERLLVLAPAPATSSLGGLFYYEISFKSVREHTGNLMVRWWPEIASTSGDDSSRIREEVLLEGVRTVQWSFADSATPGSPSDVWHPAWKQIRHLPALVRVRVQLAEGNQAAWPDLIAGPRLTDDANCEFDAVAQRCRASL